MAENIANNFEKTMKKGFVNIFVLLVLNKEPTHGYQIKKLIEERTFKFWKPKDSTMYTILNTLREKGLIRQSDNQDSDDSRKVYELTDKGKETLIDQTLATLKAVQPNYPSLLLGMIHLAVLTRDQALDALKTRKNSVAEELERIESIHFKQQPLPDYVDAIFEFSIGQLQAEAD